MHTSKRNRRLISHSDAPKIHVATVKHPKYHVPKCSLPIPCCLVMPLRRLHYAPDIPHLVPDLQLRALSPQRLFHMLHIPVPTRWHGLSKPQVLQRGLAARCDLGHDDPRAGIDGNAHTRLDAVAHIVEPAVDGNLALVVGPCVAVALDVQPRCPFGLVAELAQRCWSRYTASLLWSSDEV